MHVRAASFGGPGLTELFRVAGGPAGRVALWDRSLRSGRGNALMHVRADSFGLLELTARTRAYGLFSAQRSKPPDARLAHRRCASLGPGNASAHVRADSPGLLRPTARTRAYGLFSAQRSKPPDARLAHRRCRIRGLAPLQSCKRLFPLSRPWPGRYPHSGCTG